MRIAFLRPIFSLLTLSVGALALTSSSTQNKGIDAHKIARLETGISTSLALATIMTKPDTMVWDGLESTGILKIMTEDAGRKGELRLGIENAELRQITMNIPSKTALASAQLYDKLQTEFERRYGPPDAVYSNVQHLRKWTGSRQELALKTADSATFVSVVLRALTPKKGLDYKDSPQDVKPTRKR